MKYLRRLQRGVMHLVDMAKVAWRAWWEEPAPIIDVRERKHVIAEAEFNHRADAMSRVGRISHQPVHQQPYQREGRLTRFVQQGETLGYPSYAVVGVRGNLPLGRLEFRNQWRTYAYVPLKDGIETPLNMEILAEIYAMLRELRGQA